VERQGGVQRGVGNSGAGAGEPRGTEESGAGQQVHSTWPAKAAGGAEKNRERREPEVDEGGLVAISQKYGDSTIKPS
jgi:hypothetical protein